MKEVCLIQFPLDQARVSACTGPTTSNNIETIAESSHLISLFMNLAMVVSVNKIGQIKSFTTFPMKLKLYGVLISNPGPPCKIVVRRNTGISG